MPFTISVKGVSAPVAFNDFSGVGVADDVAIGPIIYIIKEALP